MPSMSAKYCLDCDVDLHDAWRHKTREGQYRCGECFRSYKRHKAVMRVVRPLRIAFLVAMGIAALWAVLRFVA